MGVKVGGKKYELVPPDGGWGYMIAAGYTINLISICVFLTSFGMLYKTLFIELDMDSTSITFLNGVSAFFVAISGLTTTPLLKIFSIRQLGLFAAIMYDLGTICLIFVKSQFTFIICFGILQSVGHGIMFNLSCTMLSHYFVKRRLLMVSITQFMIGFASLFSPQFIKWTLETYGFKGTILVITAIYLQNIIGVIVMHPVEWHMKKVEISETKENETKALLTIEEKPMNVVENINGNNLLDAEKNIDANNEKSNVEEQQYQGIKKFLNIFIDLSIIRSFLLSNACFGSAFSVSAEFTFVALLPQALYANGWTEADVAWALSLNAMGDLVTRGMFILLSNLLKKVGSHQIYVSGLLIAFVSRIGMLSVDNRTIVLIFITMMGIPRCTIMMLMQVVVGDSVKKDKFSSAVGLVMLLFGCFNIIFGPVIGAIRDYTGSYSIAFYILASCFGVIAIIWTTELVYKKNKHKRLRNEDFTKA